MEIASATSVWIKLKAKIVSAFIDQSIPVRNKFLTFWARHRKSSDYALENSTDLGKGWI